MLTSDHTALPSETLRSPCRPVMPHHQPTQKRGVLCDQAGADRHVFPYQPLAFSLQPSAFYLYTFSLSTWVVKIIVSFGEKNPRLFPAERDLCFASTRKAGFNNFYWLSLPSPSRDRYGIGRRDLCAI